MKQWHPAVFMHLWLLASSHQPRHSIVLAQLGQTVGFKMIGELDGGEQHRNLYGVRTGFVQFISSHQRSRDLVMRVSATQCSVLSMVVQLQQWGRRHQGDSQIYSFGA